MTDDIKKERRELEEWDREQRIFILKFHEEVYGRKMTELQEKCRKETGHKYSPLPSNGFNRPHWFHGKWPCSCDYCHKKQPWEEIE